MSKGHDWQPSGEQVWFCTQCYCRKVEQHRPGIGGIVKNIVYAPGGFYGVGRSSEYEPDCRDMQEDRERFEDARETHELGQE